MKSFTEPKLEIIKVTSETVMDQQTPDQDIGSGDF